MSEKKSYQKLYPSFAVSIVFALEVDNLTLSKKMEEQELVKIRADALGQCRKLCEGEAHANERLRAKSIQTLLSANAFAEQVSVSQSISFVTVQKVRPFYS